MLLNGKRHKLYDVLKSENRKMLFHRADMSRKHQAIVHMHIGRSSWTIWFRSSDWLKAKSLAHQQPAVLICKALTRFLLTYSIPSLILFNPAHQKYLDPKKMTNKQRKNIGDTQSQEKSKKNCNLEQEDDCKGQQSTKSHQTKTTWAKGYKRKGSKWNVFCNFQLKKYPKNLCLKSRKIFFPKKKKSTSQLFSQN